MNIVEYLRTKLENSPLIVEAIKNADVKKATDLISKCLMKKNIYTLPMVRDLSLEGEPGKKIGIVFWTESNLACVAIWDILNLASINTLAFTSDFDKLNISWINNEDFTFDVSVETHGANLVQVSKLIERVLSGAVALDKIAIRDEIRDNALFESEDSDEESLDENIEGMDSADVSQFGEYDLFEDEGDSGEELLTEAHDTLLRNLRQRRQQLTVKINYNKKKGRDTTDLESELASIRSQIIDVTASANSNVSASLIAGDEVDTYENQFSLRVSPEERFEDMKSYIYNVITGIRPLALLCGAPGVGKTFRVMQAIHGQNMVRGKDYKLLKGKCTPTALYKALFEFKDEGKLVVFDDCDSIFKDDDAINILKAAFDSSDERVVTWNVSTPIICDDTALAEAHPDDFVQDSKGRWCYPKEFEYKGGGIIVTNYQAGQIDSAIRNRALICDLDFTTDEILDIIRSIGPKIKPDSISQGARERALKYLEELANSNAPVELSIRSFTLCAGLFDSNASESAIKRRIQEQMRLQYMRGGKKY